MTLTIFLPQPAPDGYRWYKFNSRTHVWTDYTAVTDSGGARGAVFNDARDQVTLTLVDGGIGDDDGVRNGVIEDPSGLGAGIASIGTFGANNFGPSSGCFIGTTTDGRRPGAQQLPMVLGLVLALAALFSTRAAIRLLKPGRPGGTIAALLKDGRREQF